MCVKTYDSSRGLSSGASSPFVKHRMDSVSLHCARQNGLSGAWQREGFFSLWALDPMLCIPLPALLAASQLVATATGPGQHLKTIWFLMRIYFAQMVGKLGVGEGEEKGERKKERKEWGAWISHTCLELLRHTGEISKVLLRFFFLLLPIDLKKSLFDLCYMSPYKHDQKIVYEGIQLSDGWGTMPASTGIPLCTRLPFPWFCLGPVSQ